MLIKIKERIKKIIYYLYPELTKEEVKVNREKKITSKEIIKLFLLGLVPFLIMLSYLYINVKLVNSVLVIIYLSIIGFATYKEYKKENVLNKKIIINIAIIIFIFLINMYVNLK